MYLKFSEFLRAGRLCGSVVDAFIFLFNGNTLNNRSSVLKMAGIVYEGRFASPVLSQTVATPYRSVT